jgi:histidinol-phosphatase (PHP family)
VERLFPDAWRGRRFGLFDVLAHPDLVKIWGAGRPAPSRDPRAFYELALDGIAAV